MTEQDARHAFEKFTKGYRTQREAAACLGISQAYLSDILRGYRALSDTLLGRIGLERVVTIRRKAA